MPSSKGKYPDLNDKRLKKGKTPYTRTSKTNRKNIVQPCEVCGFSASRQTDMPRHAKTHASESEKLPCPWEGCTHSTLQLSNLLTHYRTHTGEKPCICLDDPEGCDFAASDPNHLLRHRIIKHDYIPKSKKKRKNKKKVSSNFQTFSSTGASTSGSESSSSKPFPCQWEASTSGLSSSRPFSGEASTTGLSSSRPFSGHGEASTSGYASPTFSAEARASTSRSSLSRPSFAEASFSRSSSSRPFPAVESELASGSYLLRPFLPEASTSGSFSSQSYFSEALTIGPFLSRPLSPPPPPPLSILPSQHCQSELVPLPSLAPSISSSHQQSSRLRTFSPAYSSGETLSPISGSWVIPSGSYASEYLYPAEVGFDTMSAGRGFPLAKEDHCQWQQPSPSPSPFMPIQAEQQHTTNPFYPTYNASIQLEGFHGTASDRLHYHPLPPNSSQFPMIIPLDSEVDANLEMMNIMMSLASVPSLNNQNYYTADSDMASSGFGNVR